MPSLRSGKSRLSGRLNISPTYNRLTDFRQRLTADDIQPNPVLIRKIKRIQAAQNAQEEDSDDEVDQRRSSSRRPQREEVTSSPPPTAQAIKRERMSQARSTAGREVSMVPNSQVNASFATDSFTVEEGDGDEEEESEEEEDDED